MTKVALASGYISQNVGNAFFQLGAYGLLSQVVGRENVFLVQDVPANWTLWKKSKGNQTNWWNVLERLDVDAFVFQGPTLTENFEKVWDDVLTRLRKANIEPIMLSIGFSRYTSDERVQALKLIKKHGLSTIFTRDQRTFDMLEPVRPSYSGIDSAFFMPWAYQPAPLKGASYLASCFEAGNEPLATIDRITGEQRRTGHRVLRARLVDKLSDFGHSPAYASQILRSGYSNEQSGAHEIVRPVHRTNPAVHARMFKDKNTIASDEPFTYLSVYANAEFTITDRVHAAVATLAYGRPAMLLSETPRRALLERIGIRFPMTEPVSADLDALETERSNEADALRGALGLTL
jgi:polysaccharide pyruvyl transferase WcaK-like protein